MFDAVSLKLILLIHSLGEEPNILVYALISASVKLKPNEGMFCIIGTGLVSSFLSYLFSLFIVINDFIVGNVLEVNMFIIISSLILNSN